MGSTGVSMVGIIPYAADFRAGSAVSARSFVGRSRSYAAKSVVVVVANVGLMQRDGDRKETAGN